MKRIVVSVGEPAGIGPDIILDALEHGWDMNITLVCSRDMLAERAALLGKKMPEVNIIDVPLEVDVRPGTLNPANSAYVLKCLELASDLCLEGKADALVTAPVHKGVICDAGFNFSGHTEFLRDRAGVDEVVMMLASHDLRVALVTTHLPLADVPKAITPSLLERVITITHQSLQKQFGINSPHIGVCGLNPHAGEFGHMGREEIDVISPVLEKLQGSNAQAQSTKVAELVEASVQIVQTQSTKVAELVEAPLSMKLTGPLPADTIFAHNIRDQFDVILAMYHDQGLAPLKALCFSESVNITLGLPYLRTSVDHGTALDLAGTGKASASSLTVAMQIA